MQQWTSNSWRTKNIKQIPAYPDKMDLERVEEKLKSYPPLVSDDEIQLLKEDLTKVSESKAFLLQGGDCAETFFEFNTTTIRDTFRVLLHMAVIFTFVGKKDVIRVGRIAGQFAKPRSMELETIHDKTLPTFRGDIINGSEFTEKSRTPNPDRIIQAYFQSASTLNFLRAFSSGKYADLDQMFKQILSFIASNPSQKHYADLGIRSQKSLDIVAASGLTKEGISMRKKKIDFYTSHEALHLHYEESLVRDSQLKNNPFDASAHFLWLGDRTRDINGAHVEFLRGIMNPIGIKCGPSMTAEELKKLLETLNPMNEPGRITLISRLGKGRVQHHLAPLIHVVKKMQHRVIWSCDPMHENTKKLADGHKTRYFDDIFAEIKEFFDTCEAEDVYPGGLHLEMTGKKVTECIGGSKNIDLTKNYETLCDPRLNDEQSIELAFKVSELLKKD